MTQSFSDRIRMRVKREQLLRKAHECTGRSVSDLRQEMQNYKQQGLPAIVYLQQKVWDMDESQKKEFMAKRGRKNSRKEIASVVSEKTGWAKEKALAELDKARRSHRISAQTYLKHQCWDLSDAELDELAATLAARKEKRARNQEWMVSVVCEKSGWTREHAVERMEAARQKGYTYRKFITEALYKLDDEGFAALARFEKKRGTSDKEAVRAARERRLSYEKAMKEEMGWNDAQLALKYLESKTNCGSSFAEFYLFGLYRLTPEEERKYITQEMHIKMQLRYCDYKGTQKYFENKALFNETFGKFVRRRWFSNEGLTYDRFLEGIQGLSKIIYKPAEGIEGIGIAVYEVNGSDEQNQAVYKDIISSGPAVIEEFLVQHNDISDFWPKSVNTIRVMSICKNGEGRVLNAVMKFGTAANVDNYFQGGIAAGVDIESGELCTDGVNAHGELFVEHPITHKHFRGFKIPNWQGVKTAIEEAAAVVKEMPYVGWDVAVREDGTPEIIEGNHNQGAYLIQYSFAVSNQEGRRPTIDPYLWFDN